MSPTSSWWRILLEGKEVIRKGMTEELDRAIHALEAAREGKKVALGFLPAMQACTAWLARPTKFCFKPMDTLIQVSKWKSSRGIGD